MDDIEPITRCSGSTTVGDQHGPVENTPGPVFTKTPKDATYEYPQFPSSMKLYMDDSMGIPNPLKYMKLCGPTKNDVIYLVDFHVTRIPGRPLRFDGSLCLLNGPNKHDPSALIAGAGDSDSQAITTDGNPETPHSLSGSCRKSVIVMPPRNPEQHPRERVDKIMFASTTPRQPEAPYRGSGIRYHSFLCFRFSIEIGAQRPQQRAEFEWIAVTPSFHKSRRSTTEGNYEPESDKLKEKRLHFVLLPAPPPTATSAATTAGSQQQEQQRPPPDGTQQGNLVREVDQDVTEDDQVLAELMFSSAWSCDHLMTLNPKGAALTRVLGDRWTLMVVMTALRITYLRRKGRTNKLKKNLVRLRNKSLGRNDNSTSRSMLGAGLAGFF